MPRAYKLPNAEATIEAIKESQGELNDLQQAAEDIAKGIGDGVKARFRRRGFSDDTGEVTFGVDNEAAELAEGWRYVKTRDAVEPVRGAKGEAARCALSALEIPTLQPGGIVATTGMSMFTMTPGRYHITQWMHHEGALYALLPDDDSSFRNDPITGDWVEIRLSELHTADEARLDAAKAAAADQP